MLLLKLVELDVSRKGLVNKRNYMKFKTKPLQTINLKKTNFKILKFRDVFNLVLISKFISIFSNAKNLDIRVKINHLFVLNLC